MTDRGLKELAACRKLDFLASTTVLTTESGIADLKKALPKLHVGALSPFRILQIAQAAVGGWSMNAALASLLMKRRDRGLGFPCLPSSRRSTRNWTKCSTFKNNKTP